MFHHIVLMRFTEAADVRFLCEVERYVERMRGELPYLRGYALVRNVASRSKGYEWAIISRFDSSAAHDAYQACELHQEMKAYMTPFIAEILACDGAAA